MSINLRLNLTGTAVWLSY